MVDAREVITAAIPCNIVYGRPQAADEIIRALAAAGFRILGPDEVDPVTVERAAAWHDHNAEMLENDDSPYSAWHKGAAAAIRALASGESR